MISAGPFSALPFGESGATNAEVKPSSWDAAGAIGTPVMGVTVRPATIPAGEAVGQPKVIAIVYISPSSVPSAQAFGKPSLRWSKAYTATGGISVGGSGGSRIAEMVFALRVRYKQTTTLVVQSDFRYNVGKLPPMWFRAEGVCKQLNSPNCEDGGPIDQSGMLPIPSMGERPIDGSCPQMFVQLIPASTPNEVCQKLKSVGFIWKLNRLSKFSQPVFPADAARLNADPSCNTLTDTPFCQLPECAEFCLDEDVQVDMGMRGQVTTNFHSYIGSGSISFHGEYEVAPSATGTVSPSGFNEQVFGKPTVDVPHSYRSEWTAFGKALEVVPVFRGIPAGPLQVTPQLVTNQCGCDRLPTTLELRHDLDRITLLADFLKRNGLAMPKVVLLTYSNLSRSFMSATHFTGLSNDGISKDRWSVVFEWSCTTRVGGSEIGPPLWLFGMLLTRRNLNTGAFAETRLLAGFPPGRVCNDQEGLDFTFTLDTQRQVFTGRQVIADISTFSDNLELFSTQGWTKKPLFEVNISGAAAAGASPRMDIRPIFPLAPVTALES